MTNTGSVGTFIETFGANANVANTGSVGSSIATFGPNSIVANSGFVGAGIVMFGANPTLTLLAGSRVVGTLDLPGPGTRTLNVGNGLNVMLTFANPPNVVNANGAPFVQVGNQVAVFDPSALAQQQTMLADLTSGISGTIYARLGNAGGGNGVGFGPMQLGADGMMRLGAAALGAGVEAASAPASQRLAFWAQGFGGTRGTDGHGPATASEQDFAGGIAGVDGMVAPGMRLGGFAGGSTASLDTVSGSHELDVTSVFGGTYVSFTGNGWFASAILTAGVSDYDSTRTVANNLAPNGLQFAHASYDGTFVSPELAIGTTVKFAGVVLEPSVRGRYAHLSLDGYTESGAADGLSVGGRDVSLWLGRAQVALPFSGPMGNFAPRVGVEARTSDDDRTNATLLGQAITFAPGGKKDEVTGFVGFGAMPNLGGGVSAFFDGEVHFGDDGIARTEARAGFVARF